MSWTEQTIFFLDFEGSRGSGVVEYGMVALTGGQVTETKTRLCRPTGPIRPEDSAVHGLRPEMMAQSALLAADWDHFAGWRERGPFAAHYAGVENSLLKAVWPYPRSSPHFGKPGERVVDWGPWVDSARLYAQFFPLYDSGNLQSLIAASGLQAELDALAQAHCPPGRCGYHAALYDALAGALLLLALGREPRLAALSLARLLALSTLDPEKREDMLQSRLW
jgi:DNA polymerase III epsilon subunit-like protein